jgi:hypothetical protein
LGHPALVLGEVVPAGARHPGETVVQGTKGVVGGGVRLRGAYRT